MAISYAGAAGQYVDYGNLSSIVGLSQKSLLLWLYLDSTPAAAETLFEIYPVSGAVDEFFLVAANFGADAGKFGIAQNFNTTNGDWRTTNDILTTGLNCVCVTYDAGSSANTPVMYSAGASVPVTTTTAPAGSAKLATASTVRMGAGQFINRSPSGRILSLAYYNRILLPSEVADAYQSRLAIPSWRGLVFAPQLWAVKDGQDLGASDVVRDLISGSAGVPTGSPVGRGDNVLTIEGVT